jgi:hypothetical protein
VASQEELSSMDFCLLRTHELHFNGLPPGENSFGWRTYQCVTVSCFALYVTHQNLAVGLSTEYQVRFFLIMSLHIITQRVK